MSFYEIRGILIRHGVVAHLGERIAGSDEVESSSLFGSTVIPRIYAAFLCFCAFDIRFDISYRILLFIFSAHHYFKSIFIGSTSICIYDISSLLWPMSFLVIAGLTPLAYKSAEKAFLIKRAYTFIPHFLLTFARRLHTALVGKMPPP